MTDHWPLRMVIENGKYVRFYPNKKNPPKRNPAYFTLNEKENLMKENCQEAYNYQEYECPWCDEFVGVHDGTPDYFECPHCQEPLVYHRDFEFVNGHWRDLSHLFRGGEKATSA